MILKYTPDCLDAIIKGLKDKGYELVLRGDYYMDHGERQLLKEENNREITEKALRLKGGQFEICFLIRSRIF